MFTGRNARRVRTILDVPPVDVDHALSQVEMLEVIRAEALSRLEMLEALADLGLLVMERSDDDPLKRMWFGLIEKALGYKTTFELRSLSSPPRPSVGN